MPAGLMMVRAVLHDAADHDAFDHWYRTEHLPDALVAFGADRAWRCWDVADPKVHFAFYEFADAETARQMEGSPELKALVAEFDRAWGNRVSRKREYMAMAE